LGTSAGAPNPRRSYPGCAVASVASQDRTLVPTTNQRPTSSTHKPHIRRPGSCPISLGQSIPPCRPPGALQRRLRDANLCDVETASAAGQSAYNAESGVLAHDLGRLRRAVKQSDLPARLVCEVSVGSPNSLASSVPGDAIVSAMCSGAVAFSHMTVGSPSAAEMELMSHRHRRGPKNE
jgi:hypothetical protein